MLFIIAGLLLLACWSPPAAIAVAAVLLAIRLVCGAVNAVSYPRPHGKFR